MNPDNRSYEEDLPLLRDIENTHDLHMGIHELVARIADELSTVSHQRIPYGDIPSMLHLHMLCHALRRDTKIYVEIEGEHKEVVACERRFDDLGRMDNALLLKVS